MFHVEHVLWNEEFEPINTEETRWNAKDNRKLSQFFRCVLRISFDLPFAPAASSTFVFAFAGALESETYKIMPQKQPKTRVSSPSAPLKSPNSNIPDPIPAQKSWRDYPVHFAILKK